jgi:hypothetical protein
MIGQSASPLRHQRSINKTTARMQHPQRPLRGSRISSFYPVKNLPSLASLDSAFQLQEYISLLIRLDVHDVAAIVSVPGKSGGKEKDAIHEGGESAEKDDKDRKSEIAVDEACWIYEQLRYEQDSTPRDALTVPVGDLPKT